MRFYIVTPGELEAKTIREDDVLALSKKGNKQAELIAWKFTDIVFNKIFTTHLAWAQETAADIVLWNEPSGDKKQSMFEPFIQEDWVDSLSIPEQAQALWGYIKDNLWKTTEDSNYVIVADSEVNQALVAIMLRYWDNIDRVIRQDDAAISAYDVPTVWPVQIIIENDTSHLEDMSK